jgi:HK97 family phage major capsid protein
MTRREALQKATLTTPDVTYGLLSAEQSKAFLRKIKDSTVLSARMRQEIRSSSAGEIDKLSTASRIIRAATENADDGYRAGATFDRVTYTTKKVRLPWEVTEDVFHENIEGAGLEATLVDEMTTQFGLDLEDLDINGDTADAGADAAFLNIDDGLLKMIAANAPVGRRVNGATINAGDLAKEHFFAAYRALPAKYRRQPGLVWIMSSALAVNWWEYLTNRAGAQGDGLLGGNNAVSRSPLGIDIITPPSWPDDRIVLADPRNFVRVVSWQIRRRRVTGETDAELAAKDKRFYVYFLKRDIIVEEYDALVDVYGMVL